MAQSAIRYKNTTRYIKDYLLFKVLRVLSDSLENFTSNYQTNSKWLVEAIEKWNQDYEDMPSGLKDIELDEWLISTEREKQLEILLDIALKVQESEISDEILKIKELLKGIGSK